ncbi:MAG TPA: ATP-grasp domain-containing protein [Candidatus Bathyarchaeia archaeon]|nr:ATP-grasp domain-containing protein [Candidatus Bathyarchaeia archaeon]
MRLYEFQAKRIFQQYGIAIPNGHVAKSTGEIVEAAHQLNRPLVLKAQVLAGGRGLAGGVKFAQKSDDVAKIGSEVLDQAIGIEKPAAVLVEEKLSVTQELYAGVTWDYQDKCAVLIGSSRGGVDIETVTKEHPEDVVKQNVDPFLGFSAYQARTIAGMIGLRNQSLNQYANAMAALWKIFQQTDAELVEANPLGLQDSGIVALDAKIVLDDRSIFRQTALLSQIDELSPQTSSGFEYRRSHAKTLGIPTYIEMAQGNMAIIADGAGSGMLTFDLVTDQDGKARVYCEMGGEITSELMERTMGAALSLEGVNVLLVNLIGGLNLMDQMAIGITNYLSKNPSKTPIVVRMSGTRQEEGRKILAAAGMTFFDDLDKAVEEAVKLSRRS